MKNRQFVSALIGFALLLVCAAQSTKPTLNGATILVRFLIIQFFTLTFLNHHFLFTPDQTPPFASFTPTQQLQGFVVDLMELIADKVGFEFGLNVSDTHGSVDENGKWNGMIGELVQKVS